MKNIHETLEKSKEVIRKNGLRVAFGASIAVNGGIIYDATAQDGKTTKRVVTAIDELGRDIVREIYTETCFNPENDQRSDCVRIQERNEYDFNW